MGYDLGLFEGNEDEIVDDLICPICKGKTHRGVKIFFLQSGKL